MFSALFSLRRKDWNSISQPVEVQALSAACLLIRREVIDTIGVLAEDYFLFSEENDYFCRMRRAGFKSYYLPEAEVIHLVGQSRKKRAGFDSDVNFLRSRLIYFQKFHRRTLGVLRAVYRFFLGWSLGMARLSYAVKGRRDDYHIELYRHLRQTLGETDR